MVPRASGQSSGQPSGQRSFSRQASPTWNQLDPCFYPSCFLCHFFLIFLETLSLFTELFFKSTAFRFAPSDVCVRDRPILPHGQKRGTCQERLWLWYVGGGWSRAAEVSQDKTHRSQRFLCAHDVKRLSDRKEYEKSAHVFRVFFLPCTRICSA